MKLKKLVLSMGLLCISTLKVFSTDTVWVDDSLPPGSQEGNGEDLWAWVSNTPPAFSGILEHQTGTVLGQRDQGFNFCYDISGEMDVNTGDTLFTYVYLPTNNPPAEIEIAWNTTDTVDSWEHRAYFGSNIIYYGTDGTPSRTNMGALPPLGQWAKLSIPASAVGLEGKTIQGMFFTVYNTNNASGPTTWDYTGKSDSSASTDVPVSVVDYVSLMMPTTNDYVLHVLSPTNLELVRINSKPPDPAHVYNWDFVDSTTNFVAPSLSKFVVLVNGQTNLVKKVGFKRRPFYAPEQTRDFRIANSLYLQLSNSISDNETVQVLNPDGTLWPSTMFFTNSSSTFRYGPAIHVNQEGYLPAFSKVAMVGYYLGNLGEMPVPSTNFSVVDAITGTAVYQGTMTLRPDLGYTYTHAPYQQVFQADFSSLTNTGEFELVVPGLGASLPFMVEDGIAMDFARTYALGLYHQRCGTNNALPFTRFVHDPCHTNRVEIPMPYSSPQFAFTWNTISNYSKNVELYPGQQDGPAITNAASLLYPYPTGVSNLDLSGGYHDAGDYSKYTIGVTHLIHSLVFAADAIPGVAALDNLGMPESGDGKSDVLQAAKWQTDFLVKMQDTNDGAFYFLVYPTNSEYEAGLPGPGGQVVWPKNTAATAAAVAALAETASSPLFKQQFPTASALYLQRATMGWKFLTNAFHLHGNANSYQKLTFYGDLFTHTDEVAWAACEMFLATTNQYYFQQLTNWFPNPNDPGTMKWGEIPLTESFGNAIRSYAFGARSGRVLQSALNSSYWSLCTNQIISAANQTVSWSQSNSYATSFPLYSKGNQLNAGWYFSMHQAYDIAVGYQLNPSPGYVTAILGNMNYEAGCNPLNASFVEGLGWKRQREIVDQYSDYDKRVLPRSGVLVGNLQGGFDTTLPNYVSVTGGHTNNELLEMVFPAQDASTDPYPMYDRWADSYNLNTEYITINQARSLGAAAFIAGMTSLTNQSWVSGTARIVAPTNTALLGNPITATLAISNLDTTGIRVVWEAQDQEPSFGDATSQTNFTFTPAASKGNGFKWIEAEAQWPDGRRVFAANNVFVDATNLVWIDDSLPAGAVTTADNGGSWNWISSSPTPFSGSLAFKQANITGEHLIQFTGASQQMYVGTNDNLYAYVYLDATHPPAEIVLIWIDETGQFGNVHVAWWGTWDIAWWSPGQTASMGALPATGQWVKLTVPGQRCRDGRPHVEWHGLYVIQRKRLLGLRGRLN